MAMDESLIVELSEQWSQRVHDEYTFVLYAFMFGVLFSVILGIGLAIFFGVHNKGNPAVICLLVGFLQLVWVPIVAKIETFINNHYNDNERSRFERDYIRNVIPFKYKI